VVLGDFVVILFSKAVRPISINGWLSTYLTEFNVEFRAVQAVIRDLRCERGDLTLSEMR
jgi:hypothetical protein